MFQESTREVPSTCCVQCYVMGQCLVLYLVSVRYVQDKYQVCAQNLHGMYWA